MNRMFANLPTTIFEVMSSLARRPARSISARASQTIPARGHAASSGEAVLNG